MGISGALKFTSITVCFFDVVPRLRVMDYRAVRLLTRFSKEPVRINVRESPLGQGYLESQKEIWVAFLIQHDIKKP